MRQSSFLSPLFLTLALSFPLLAHADGYTASGSGGGFSGSGTLTATDEGSGEYQITDITGAGFEGLFPPNGFQGNDNLLFPDAAQYVDSSGFSFTVSDGEDTDNVDISWNGTGYQAYLVDEGGNVEIVPVTFDLTADGPGPALKTFFAADADTATFAFTVAAATAVTPEPSSLALLGTGLAAAVAMGRRRVRA